MRRDMDEDINWGKLFLKVILAFVIILFVIWLVSKLFMKNTKGTEAETVFVNNLEQMYEVASEYFEDDSKLPQDGKRVVLTLKEMIDKDLIDELKVGKTVCSTKEKNSYAKVSNKGGKYTLTVLLTCGSNSDYISKVISDKSNGKEDIENTTVKEESTSTNKGNSNSANTNNNTSSSNSGTNSNSSNNSNNSGNTSTTTQEVEKVVVTDYTTMEYKFCKIESEKYYTVVYLNSSDLKVGSEITYTIKLDDLKNVSKISVVDDNYFLSNTYFKNYTKTLDNNFTVIDAKSAKNIAGSTNNLIKASLKSNNFDYTLTEVYQKDGNYYVDVTITIKKVNSNSDTYNGTSINYVPVYFNISYADLDNCVTDTYKNSTKYDDYYVIK